MKTSKLLITSLLAAAAMGANAFAEVYSEAQTLTQNTTFNQSSYKIYNGGLAVGTYDFTLSQTDSGYITSYINGLSGSGAVELRRTNDSGANSAVLWLDGDCSNYTGTISANQETIALTPGTYTYYSTRLILGSSSLSGGLNLSNATLNAQSVVLGLASDVRVKSFSTTSASQVGVVSGTVSTTITGGTAGTIASNDANATPITTGTIPSRTITVTNSATLTGTTFLAGVNLAFESGATGTLSGITMNTGSITSAGNLTVSGTSSLKDVAVTGGTLDLSGGTITLANAIQNSGTVTVNANTIFVLSDSLKVGDTGNTYSLISGGNITDWSTLTTANFRISGATISLRGASADVSTDGQVAFTAGTAANLTWKGSASTTWDVQGAQNWTNDSTSSADVFYDYDSVTFDASTTVTTTNIADDVTVTDLTISGGTHTFTVSSGSYVKITGTASVENGATLVLDTKTDGKGLLRGAITVKSGGELQFTKGDLTGYNGGEDSLRSITIDAGGRLYLNHSTNETFAGTLTLNGTLSGNDENTRWDMYGGSSQIVVGEGANASIDENVKLVIRRDNAPITVGADATLTINGQVLKSSEVGAQLGGNGVLVKNGVGKLTLNGNVNVTGVTQNAGTLTIGGAATITTLTVSGGTTTFASSSPVNITTANLNSGLTNLSSTGTTSIGSLSMKTGASATQTSGIVTISGDVRLHTSNGSTTETYTLSGGVLNITKTASLSIAADTSTDANYNASAIFLGVWKDGKGQLAVQGGTLNVLNSQVVVGFDSSAEVAMSSGEMNVKGVVLYGKNSGNTSNLTVTGGRLNVGSEGLITSTASTSNATKTISISDATVGSLDSWNANGSITLGGTVTFDTTKMVASTTGKSSADATDTEGTTITLNGVLSGDGALKKAGAGTLTLSNANIYTGGTVIEAGTVVAAHASALGTTKGVEVQSGATLNLGTSAVTVAGLSGAGTVGLADGRTSATLTVNGGGVFTGTLNGGTNSLELVFDADGQTLELNPTLANALSSVDVRAGTVKTGNALGLGYSANVTVQSLGTLEFTTSDLTKDSGLTLIDGGGITFKNGASFVVDVTGAATDVALSIITSSVIKFYNGSEDVSLISDNLDQFVNNFVTLKGWDGLADWAYDGLALSVTLTIPEPSTFGLLVGLGALALAGTRRRRRK